MAGRGAGAGPGARGARPPGGGGGSRGPASLGRGAACRAGVKDPWYCKSCSIADAKGFRKVNFGERMQCKWCNLPKAACFGGKPVAESPSVRVGPSDKEKLAKAMERIRRLEEEAKQAKAAPAAGPEEGGAAGVAPWREGSPEKQRLEVVDAKLQALKVWADAGDEEEFVAQQRAKLEAEQAKLREALFASKPKEVQLKSLSDRIKKQEKQLEKGRSELDAVELQMQELEAKSKELRAAQAEKEAHVAELKAEHARTLGATVRPPAEPGAGLDGVVEIGGQRIAAEILGKLLGSFTVEQELATAVLKQANAREQEIAAAAKAAADAAAERRAAAERAQAREPTDGPGGGAPREDPGGEHQRVGDDAMDDEELNVDIQYEFLKKAGHAPAAEDGADKPAADVVRAAYKRFFDGLGVLPFKKHRSA